MKCFPLLFAAFAAGAAVDVCEAATAVDYDEWRVFRIIKVRTHDGSYTRLKITASLETRVDGDELLFCDGAQTVAFPISEVDRWIFEETPILTGAEMIGADALITYSPAERSLHIGDISGRIEIEVYDIQGCTLYSAQAASGDIVMLPSANTDVMIVRAGNRTFKIIGNE